MAVTPVSVARAARGGIETTGQGACAARRVVVLLVLLALAAAVAMVFSPQARAAVPTPDAPPGTAPAKPDPPPGAAVPDQPRSAPRTSTPSSSSGTSSSGSSSSTRRSTSPPRYTPPAIRQPQRQSSPPAAQKPALPSFFAPPPTTEELAREQAALQSSLQSLQRAAAERTDQRRRGVNELKTVADDLRQGRASGGAGWLVYLGLLAIGVVPVAGFIVTRRRRRASAAGVEPEPDEAVEVPVVAAVESPSLEGALTVTDAGDAPPRRRILSGRSRGRPGVGASSN